MKVSRILPLVIAALVGAFVLAAPVAPTSEPKEGAIRVLFLGHESEHHNSNKYYPMLAKALGRDAIYFDYAEMDAKGGTPRRLLAVRKIE